MTIGETIPPPRSGWAPTFPLRLPARPDLGETVTVEVTVTAEDGTAYTLTARALATKVTTTLDKRDPDDGFHRLDRRALDDGTLDLTLRVQDLRGYTMTVHPAPDDEELPVPDPTPEGPRPISATDRRALDALAAACQVARGPVAATALGPAFPDASQRALTGMLRRLVDAGHADRIRVAPVALYTPVKAP